MEVQLEPFTNSARHAFKLLSFTFLVKSLVLTQFATALRQTNSLLMVFLTCTGVTGGTTTAIPACGLRVARAVDNKILKSVLRLLD